MIKKSAFEQGFEDGYAEFVKEAQRLIRLSDQEANNILRAEIRNELARRKIKGKKPPAAQSSVIWTKQNGRMIPHRLGSK